MRDPYYLDLESYSLTRLQGELEAGPLLPGRLVLAERTEERFSILRAHGIYSLKQLIEALKTKQKIARFTAESGLPLDYLTILGREARSYMPKLVFLRDIPFVDPEAVQRLAEAGILHSKHLFHRAKTPAERGALCSATGIAEETILELVRLSDLARVRGLGPTYVRLLYEAGADCIEALSRWDPVALGQSAHNANQRLSITRSVPGQQDMAAYIAMAHELEKTISYEHV
jgi:hypothetical protein